MNEYTCARCKGTFLNPTPEFVKVAEAERNFGRLPVPEDRVSLCDDCYKWFMEKLNALSPEDRKRLEEEMP